MGSESRETNTSSAVQRLCRDCSRVPEAFLVNLASGALWQRICVEEDVLRFGHLPHAQLSMRHQLDTLETAIHF